MMKRVVFIVGSIIWGCTSGKMALDDDLVLYLKQVANVPKNRFVLCPEPDENLVDSSVRRGLFSAGVERDHNDYWLWIRTAMGNDKPFQEEIYKFNGKSLASAGPEIKMGYSGQGLIRQPDKVLEHWYDISFGYKIKTNTISIEPNQLRSPTHLKDTPWVECTNSMEVKVQQAILANLIPRFAAIHTTLQQYEITLYRSKGDIYLLECWRDAQGDWYLGYRYGIPVTGGRSLFLHDPKLSFDGTRLSRGWWDCPKPWASIVKWKR